MKNKLVGTVSFYLQTTQDCETTKTTYDVPATLYSKNDKNYLFFEDQERVKCRFEFDEENLRMRREGPMVVDQNHIYNKTTTGYIKTPYGQLSTKIKTHDYLLRQKPKLKIVLAYDLYIDHEITGTYQLQIQFKEGARSR